MAKLYILKATEHNGEYEYPYMTLVRTDLEPEATAEQVALHHIRGESEFDEDDWMYYVGGELGITIDSMTPITDDEYSVLSKYISTIEV